MKKILVLDTTLRDGEQVPGAKLNIDEKLKIAQQLKKLGVDYIEAGFPASSEGDFLAVKNIASNLGNEVRITALARAVKKDIQSVYDSIKFAEDPLIHIVLGTSNIHIKEKFSKSQDEILNIGIESVKFAKSLMPNVQYSTEDASRSDFEYLWKTIEAVVKAGATIINIPDTVGYAVPEEFGNLISKINYRLKNLNSNVLLSVHCHNDTGLATSNTLSAIKNGADKIECTINGIGERAGNAALEEVIMGLNIRQDYYCAYTGINTRQIKNSSNLVSRLSGLDIQVNKAITGENAFSHSSGIHQDGLLKSRNSYEIINPEDVGVNHMDLILTARSGRHAFKNALNKLGYFDNNTQNFELLFTDFIKLADIKKEVYDTDLIQLLNNYDFLKNKNISDSFYEIIKFEVISNNSSPSATVILKQNNSLIQNNATGKGPVDALYSALNKAVNIKTELIEYKISSISHLNETQGRVTIKLKYNSIEYCSRAVDTDIIKASAIAYINCINSINLSLNK